MLRRIYCLVPNLEVARKVVDEVLLARVEEKHIHVLAKRGYHPLKTSRGDDAAEIGLHSGH